MVEDARSEWTAVWLLSLEQRDRLSEASCGGDAMIEVEGLTRSFGRQRVLDAISFTVPARQIAGFLGQNGAGKTTTMRILTTFLPPDPISGAVRVAGLDVTSHAREVCRRVGYLPESVPIFPELRVAEYLRFRARLKGLGTRRVKERVGAVLDLCDLTRVARRSLGVLSKGFRQRVGLADALLAEPEVLILDEPTSGLDPQQVAEVRRIIGRLSEVSTVFLSSHVLGEVEQVCDQIVILGGGTIRARETREGWTQRLERSGRLELLLKDPSAGAEKRLRSLSGVTEVAKEGGRFVIASSCDVREQVFALAVERRWTVLELTPRPATLESLFLELVSDEGVA